MKSYEPYADFDEKLIVKVTLQSEEYFGHIWMEVGGNCRGLDVLKCADFDSETFENCKKDFTLGYNEDRDYFIVQLKDEHGNILEIEESAYRMNRYIVAVEFVDSMDD